MITQVRIIPNVLELRIGETYPLGVDIIPRDATYTDITWSSSNSDAVEIVGTIVQAKAYGRATIVCNIDGVIGKCKIEVVPQNLIQEDTCSDLPPVKADQRWLKTDRIYAQYRNKPSATRWFNITRRISYPLYEAMQKVRRLYDIDTNVGKQLDIIGRIVGIDRSYISDIAMSQSMYKKDAEGAMYGLVSSMYSSGVVAGRLDMNDELFRLVIKAKIIKNNTNAYYDDILRGFRTLFPHIQEIWLRDFEDMSFGISYIGNLTSLEKWALLNIGLLPKPAGVRFRGFVGIPVGLVQAGDYTKQVGDPDAQAMNINLIG